MNVSIIGNCIRQMTLLVIYDNKFVRDPLGGVTILSLCEIR